MHEDKCDRPDPPEGKHRSDVEEAGTFVGRGQAAALVVCEQSMTIARKPVVDAVAQRVWNQPGDGSQQYPTATKYADTSQDGVRAHSHVLRGLSEVQQQYCGVSLLRIQRVPGEDFGGQRLLLLRKVQQLLRIVLYHPSHAVPAEAAVPVIEQNAGSNGRLRRARFAVGHPALLY